MLLEAARALMAEGQEPGIEAVAAQAGVSRATAYRYFGSAEALVLEATLDSTLDVAPPPTTTSDSTADRVARVQGRLYDHAREHEAQLRLYLASALRLHVESDGKAEVRMGRRLPMIEDAIGPARTELTDAAYQRLVCALAAMMGIDSLIVLRDVCALDHDAARDTMAWAVRTLVAAALRQADDSDEPTS